MRVGLQTWGSDGDIRPVIALGAALVRRGHEVRLAVASVDNHDYRSMCEHVGVTCLRAPERFASSPAELTRRWGDRASFARMFQVLLHELLYPALGEMQEAADALCASCDVVVGHFMVWPLKVAAEKRKTPWATLAYFPPLVCNPAWALPGLPSLGRTLNAGLIRGLEALFLRVLGTEYAEYWRTHGFEPGEIRPSHWFSPRLNLVAASPLLWPLAPDESQHRLCGHFHMPDEAEPAPLDPDLERFLSEGEPPVFLTLGSSGETDPERSERLLLEAARVSGLRAVVRHYSGAPPPDAGPGVFLVDRVSHGRLLPRCSAVVHHGGAGTTHSVLAAGRPSVVVAFMDEQVAWGRQLVRVGAARSVFRYPRVSVTKLAKAITEAVRSPELRLRAEVLGPRLREEDGVGVAATLLEEFVSLGRRRPRSSAKELALDADAPLLPRAAPGRLDETLGESHEPETDSGERVDDPVDGPGELRVQLWRGHR